ncbi:hypothetical protein FOA43_002283 [Brettanomyces nanus]|uniref:Uncharacterized protein n=1 Tax=Eeniella nana TaxID=13502 RepID=A0A875S3J6_EENNA|nr:uncharacterized protein FOA43_002283 [Brettanomyces nanus]QPG74945.1 hypothetical protein FOA43_002283 [Brettanomyces nanus]
MNKPSGFSLTPSNSTTPGFSFGKSGTTTNTSANSGGLFDSKPASGGLFGSNTTSSGFNFGHGNVGDAVNTGNIGNIGNTGNVGNAGNAGNSGNMLNQIPQLTPMTKVSDLPEQFQRQLEVLDGYIQTQVSISEYLKNNESEHRELIDSIPRDIEFLEKKYVSTNQALNSDLKFIEGFKTKTLESFNDWVERLIKVYLQLTNPMSSSTSDQNQTSNSARIVIGVNGTRSAASPSVQKQKQKNAPSSDKNSPLNVTQILNSYYATKIDDFNENIHKYQLVLQDVESSINNLDRASLNGGPMTMGGNYGLEMVISTLREEFMLYVELANEFAETHHRVNRFVGGSEAF